MYQIVSFDDEDMCELAPNSWLSGSNCYWPPTGIKGNVVSKFIKNMETPKDSWPLYPVKVLGTAETYEIGREKARKAQFRSELSSDPEYGRGNRIKKLKRAYDDYVKNTYSSESDEEVYSESLLSKIPPPISKTFDELTFDENEQIPPVVIENFPPGSLILDTQDEELFNKESQVKRSKSSLVAMANGSKNLPGYRLKFNHLDSSNRTTETSKSPGSRFPHRSRFNEEISSSSQVHGTQIANPMSFNSPPASCLKNNDTGSCASYYRAVLRELKIVRHQNVQTQELLELLLQKTNSTERNPIPEKSLIFEFPAKSDRELLELCSQVGILENKAELIQKLQQLGGHDFKDHTRRALRLIMTDAVAELYTWFGSKEKNKFCGLNISEIIIDSVVQAHPGVLKNKVEEVIKNWLRHAKERRIYSEKKE